MVAKRIILLLIILLISATMSGCLSSDKKEGHEAGGSSGGSQRQREMRTPEGVQGRTWTPEKTGNEGETWTSEETGIEEVGTQKDTLTQEGLETSTETETQRKLSTPEETGVSETQKEPETRQTEANLVEGEQPGAVQPKRTIPTSYIVRLKDYYMIPSSLEVDIGDTVVWRNYQESGVLILTSGEYLFKNQRLAYGDTLKHTFDKPGSYNFSVKGYPKMQMTITVK